MPKLDSLEPLFIEELKDLLDAEQKLTKALPKLAKKASTPELKRAIEDHLRQTEGHVERLNQVFQSLGMKPATKTCIGIDGLIEEGEKTMSLADEDSVRDAALIAGAQKAEHYEIAGYGTVRTYATRLGHTQAARLLEQTLEEEKMADKKLTQIAEMIVNPEAARANH